MRRVTSNYQQHSSSITEITQKWEQQNANVRVSSHTKFQQNLPDHTEETSYNIMQGTDNYTPETSQVSRVYSSAAILYLQFMLHVMFFPMLNVVMYPTSGITQVSLIPIAGFTKAIRNVVEAICEDQWTVRHVPSSAVF
jgi:FMN-dependent NADH-azoreductase